jgi:hypothetical protein
LGETLLFHREDNTMRRRNPLLILALVAWPLSSFAGDKKESRSLADDAAYLAEKSGKNEWNGWESDKVTVIGSSSRNRSSAKLFLHFTAKKDKPIGTLFMGLDLLTAPKIKVETTYEVVEKEGKRYFEIMRVDPLARDDPAPKVLATLEYTLEAGDLTIRGGVIPELLGGWGVDYTKGITFKATGK